MSFAGRLMLIKAVLSNLPMYYLSLFKMPEGIAKEIDSIQAAFLWGGTDLKRKVHMVRWNEVTLSKSQEGLGIRRIRDVNVCLLLKWWWRFANEGESLWKKVICSKHNLEGADWFPSLNQDNRSSKIWKDILAVAECRTNLVQFYVNHLRLQWAMALE